VTAAIATVAAELVTSLSAPGHGVNVGEPRPLLRLRSAVHANQPPHGFSCARRWPPASTTWPFKKIGDEFDRPPVDPDLEEPEASPAQGDHGVDWRRRGEQRFDFRFRGLKNCKRHAGVLSARRQLSLPKGKDMLPC